MLSEICESEGIQDECELDSMCTDFEPAPKPKGEFQTKEEGDDLLYAIEDVPPWSLCLLLGFQHYLTMLGSTLALPLILAPFICIEHDAVGLTRLVATYFFVAGISTLLQSTIGVRLPIIQSTTMAYFPPAVIILSQPQWKCPQNWTGDATMGPMLMNETLAVIDGKEVWQSRLREIQGAICVAAMFQVLIGGTGLLSIMLRYVGPLTIAPTIGLAGLSVAHVIADKAATHWWIAIMTIVLVAIFSQYLRNVALPAPACCKKKRLSTGLPIFKWFPIILSVLISWLICVVLTMSGVLPSNPDKWGYMARTDIRTKVIDDTAWFMLPYPGQWGIPTVSVGAVLGMMTGALSSTIESIGDYYACARLSGAPPPPSSAVNRGILLEGLTSLMSGLLGTGVGTTSYTENVGAVSITRIGSRRVVQTAGFIIVVFACLGKLNALFVTIPDPVIGGLLMTVIGMVTAVGISNLQHVNMSSSRNLFVIACSFFIGLAVPLWLNKHSDAIDTGVPRLNQVLMNVFGTSMFMGGLIGFVLDNTLPGTPKDRGLIHWNTLSQSHAAHGHESSYTAYDIPVITQMLRPRSWARFIPFCPESDVISVPSEPEKNDS